jgi:AbrB family looped-hinge helix DNA binding protein
MNVISTLSSKFQISIPKSIREAEGWVAGQKFVFIPRGKGVLLMPVLKAEELFGFAKGANTENYRDC